MTYAIVMTREFYGPAKRKSLVLREDGQCALRFATISAAKAMIADLDNEVYYLAHNESARPVYSVAPVVALPAYLAQQA